MNRKANNDEPDPEPPAGAPMEADEAVEAVEIPIEDAIDLHAYAPRDVKAVVEEYLYQCRARGFAEVRVIHGRGTGAQREIVRAALGRSPHVLSFRDAPAERGGWGATIVALRQGPP